MSAQVFCCSMATPHWMAAGLVRAKRRAASMIFSRGTQVICSTLSRGYSLTLWTNVIPAVGIILDKFFIVEFFLDDHLGQAQGQGRIRSRPELKPDIGPGCGPGQPGIDHDQFGPGRQGPGEALSLVTIRIADDHIVSPHHDASGEIFIIDDGIGPAGEDAGGDTRAIAEMTGRKHIRRAEKIGKTVDDRLVFPARAVAEDDRFGPKIFFVGQNPLGNDVQGRIPGDAFPVTASTCRPFASEG